MRSLEVTGVIKRDHMLLWGSVAHPDFCRLFAEALSFPFSGLFEARLKPGPGNPGTPPAGDAAPSRGLRAGDEVVILTAKGGKTVMRLHVDKVVTPNLFAFSELRKEVGLASYLMKTTVELEEYGANRTKVTIVFVVMLFNRLIEFLTWVLPFRIYFSFFVRRALKKLSAAAT
ncbi:MAG: hypothetical protein ABII00_19330 [Elusimicrobiota bacterium]